MIEAIEDHDYESIPNTSVTINMIAGALAGITEHTVTFPIDAIKTRIQFLSSTAVSSNPASAASQSIPRLISRMYMEGGCPALFRGLSSVLIGAGPSHALYFSTYEHFKTLFRKYDRSEHQHGAHAAAGVLATTAHDAFATPFDVVKQRMQISSSCCGGTPCASVANGSRVIFNDGLIRTATHILRTEGLKAFYVSYPTTLTMSIPYQCFQFITYEYTRKKLNPDGVYDPKSHIVAGATAGTVAACLTTPLDVAKTVLQTRGLVGTDSPLRHVSGLFEACGVIYRRRGLIGFTSGMTARVISIAPATAICWTTYEFMKMFIATSRIETPEANLHIGEYSKSSLEQ